MTALLLHEEPRNQCRSKGGRESINNAGECDVSNAADAEAAEDRLQRNSRLQENAHKRVMNDALTSISRFQDG
jgi:hypothetical protein